MIDFVGFKNWLFAKSTYSKATISNTVSRVKRADKILPLFDDLVYLFHLDQQTQFRELSTSVKSQIKKAVKLYFEFKIYYNMRYNLSMSERKEIKVLSLFANIGVAEAYFKELDIPVVVANELIERRANLYSQIYPNTKMIAGDITDKNTFNKIVSESIKENVNLIMATPPCQGMSTAGQQCKNDYRNTLICPVVDAIKQIQPNYVFLENVALFFNTYIKVEEDIILIPELLERELGHEYCIRKYIIDTKDYSVPQTRERAIVLMTKKDASIKEWLLPKKSDKVVTMRDAIGHLPQLDPFVKDVSEKELLEMFPDFYTRKSRALSISHWNNPPHHIKRQIIAMQHTPTGCTAFDNEIYFPVKEDGTPVKGYHNTYKRQNWDTAAYTVTMDNRKISSQNNVHPGRLIGKNEKGEIIFSDPRTLTLYEIMIIMSLPKNWPIPENTSEAFLRRIIGEGIPPLFVKKVFQNLIEVQQ